ncbi:unnamed protein product [Lampetra fluviatilis]
MRDDEEVFIQNVPGDNPEINLWEAREAAAALVTTEPEQPQYPEGPLNCAAARYPRIGAVGGVDRPPHGRGLPAGAAAHWEEGETGSGRGGGWRTGGRSNPADCCGSQGARNAWNSGQGTIAGVSPSRENWFDKLCDENTERSEMQRNQLRALLLQFYIFSKGHYDIDRTSLTH